METTPEFTPTLPQPEQIESQRKKESISVPTSLIRWFCYVVLFQVFLIPIAVWTPLNPWCTLSIAAILGHFAGQLNKLLDK